MSRTKPRGAEELQCSFLCTTEYCQGSPGRWCTTRTGKWVVELHTNRFKQWLKKRASEQK